MKFLAGLALALVTSAAVAVFPAPVNPSETVRVLADKDGQIMCSAVALAPERAVTAAHCLEDVMYLDGYVVTEATVFEGTDVAVLQAPGLPCPCAPIGAKPNVGDKAFAIGFPGGGPKRQTADVTVQHVGPLAEFAPWILNPEVAALEIVGVHDFVLIPGDSGGGLFSVQDGEAKLIGINAGRIFMPPSGLPFGNFFSQLPGGL